MIHVLMRYIGIKTKLLKYIRAEVEKITPTSGCVLDLFAGSTIVGQSLSDKYKIYSNDIQRYSYIVGKATLEINPDFDYSKLSYKKILNSSFYIENYSYLCELFKDPLSFENELFFKLKGELNSELLNEFKLYYDNSPYSGHFEKNITHHSFLKMKDIYSIDFYEKARKSKEHYCLFSLNYACPYFSLQQAIFIDSYRYAIDNMLRIGLINSTEYHIYLSMLIYYLGNIVTSVGDHYAQPQKLKLSNEKRLRKEVDKIISKKTLDVYSCFDSIETEFKKITYTGFDNKMFCEDYKTLFDCEYSDFMKGVDTIYIDPPYTNAHYSRFYHILETLVKYDYPEISFFGRYRNDRYQSPFCIRTEALKEFEHMIFLSCKVNKNLVISYSDTSQCILTKEEITDICKKYYKKTTIKEIDYLYRNFGQKPNKVKGNELLIICEAK